MYFSALPSKVRRKHPVNTRAAEWKRARVQDCTRTRAHARTDRLRVNILIFRLSIFVEKFRKPKESLKGQNLHAAFGHIFFLPLGDDRRAHREQRGHDQERCRTDSARHLHSFIAARSLRTRAGLLELLKLLHLWNTKTWL